MGFFDDGFNVGFLDGFIVGLFVDTFEGTFVGILVGGFVNGAVVGVGKVVGNLVVLAGNVLKRFEAKDRGFVLCSIFLNVGFAPTVLTTRSNRHNALIVLGLLLMFLRAFLPMLPSCISTSGEVDNEKLFLTEGATKLNMFHES